MTTTHTTRLLGRDMTRDEARTTILATLADHRYTMADTAQSLGIEYRQLARLVARLGLGAEIDAARAAAGVAAPPRPPRTAAGAGARPAPGRPLDLLHELGALTEDERDRFIRSAVALYGKSS